MSREQLIVALLVLAPGALVLIVALLRGYDVLVLFTRRNKRDKGE